MDEFVAEEKRNPSMFSACILQSGCFLGMDVTSAKMTTHEPRPIPQPSKETERKSTSFLTITFSNLKILIFQAIGLLVVVLSHFLQFDDLRVFIYDFSLLDWQPFQPPPPLRSRADGGAGRPHDGIPGVRGWLPGWCPTAGAGLAPDPFE